MCSLLCVLVLFLVVLWVVAALVLSNWVIFVRLYTMTALLHSARIPQKWPWWCHSQCVSLKMHLASMWSRVSTTWSSKKKKKSLFHFIKKKRWFSSFFWRILHGIVQLGTKPMAGQLKHCWGRVGRSINTGSLIAFTAHSSRLHVRRRMSQTPDPKYPSYMRLCGELSTSTCSFFTKVAFSLMLALLELLPRWRKPGFGGLVPSFWHHLLCAMRLYVTTSPKTYTR